jgi:hypothetical protein
MAMHRNPLRRRIRATLVAALLAVALAGAGLHTSGQGGVNPAAAAGASSDIPGIPLPGPISAGRLGGAIYDVVYRFSVLPGHVIIASLTGAAGTDFDIYLFDGSAQTVLSDVGLLKKSTGPISTESITWSSPLGGTYYIDLNGATDIEGDYRLTLQTVPDSTPPSVSVVLAQGRGSTNVLAVPVDLTAVDDLSGVSEMALSPDAVAYTAWQPFESITTWTFPPGDGVRTLWAKVRNGVGLESEPAAAEVTIDTDPPGVELLSPTPGSSVVGLRPPFNVVFDESVDPGSWTNFGLIVQAATGALVPGAYTYDVSTKSGTFIPANALQPGLTYVVALGDVRDVAGNRIPPGGSWTVIPLAPSELEARATPPVILRGASARLDLTLSGAPPPAFVQVSRSWSGSGGFVPLATLEVVNGRLTLPVQPDLTTTYRFQYSGSFGVAPADLIVPVLVRRSVVLVGRSSTVTARASVGASVKLTAEIDPESPGITVSFRLYRFDAVKRVWVYAGSRGRKTDPAGRATYSWIPPSTGSYYWRVSVVSTTEYANNTSPVYRWSISR